MHLNTTYEKKHTKHLALARLPLHSRSPPTPHLEDLTGGRLRFDWAELHDAGAKQRWIEAMHTDGVALVTGALRHSTSVDVGSTLGKDSAGSVESASRRGESV